MYPLFGVFKENWCENLAFSSELFNIWIFLTRFLFSKLVKGDKGEYVGMESGFEGVEVGVHMTKIHCRKFWENYELRGNNRNNIIKDTKKPTSCSSHLQIHSINYY